MFGASFELRARFSNASGLREGNNVLYAGIQAGMVKSMRLVNDTTIEVTLQIANKLKDFINKNAIVSIASEGLMGNKVIQIQPKGPGKMVEEGDLLQSKGGTNIDEMLEVLSRTTQNVEDISGGLKVSVTELNKSALMTFLKDKKTAGQLMSALVHLNHATANFEQLGSSLATGSKNPNGMLGMLMADSALAVTIRQAAIDLRSASGRASQTVRELEQLAGKIDSGLSNKKSVLHLLVGDTVLNGKLQQSMDNIKDGTAGFNRNMEALKENFLFRGYFRKLEKQNAKQKPKQN